MRTNFDSDLGDVELKDAGADPTPNSGPEIKALSDQLKTTFESMKEFDKRAEAERKQLGEATAETKAAMDKVQNRLDDIEKRVQRSLTAAGVKSGKAEGDEDAAETKAQLGAFDTYFRKGDRRMSDVELKALATDNDTEGGYMVPEVRANRLIEKLIEFSPVRELATVETITTGNAYEVPAEGAQNFDAGWVSERASRPETDAGKLRMERIPVHEMYANPFVTRTMLEDAGFDVEGWSSRRVGTRFGVIEGLAFVSGDGAGKPEGLLTHANITEVNSGSAALLTADGLIDLVFDLPEFYTKNANFLMKRSTIRAIRKLKDSQNRYLWEPGLNGGTAPAILGHGYREAIDMPAVAADAFPIVFGDFKAGYTVVDRRGIVLIRDETSSKPFIEMYHTKRTGGQVVLAEAFRKQKCSA